MKLATPHTISLLHPSPSPARLSPSLHSLIFPKRVRSLSYSSQTSSFPDAGDDFVVGDCLVFEEGIFEDPYLETEDVTQVAHQERKKNRRVGAKRIGESEIEPENLVPEEWRDIQAEACKSFRTEGLQSKLDHFI